MTHDQRAELLRALFDEGKADGDEASQADLERVLAAAEAELRRDIGETEAAFAEAWSPLRETRLVGRVLRRTTREDLGWRGEVRVVSEFVRERLSGSPLLRVVAASLVVHVAAVPALAWYVLRDDPEPKGIRIEIAPAPDDGDVAADVPEESPLDDAIDRAEREAARREDRIDNALRRARFVLSTASAAPSPAAAELVADDATSEVARLVATRVLALEGALAPDELGALPTDDLGRLLWTEAELDAFARTGHRDAELARALNGFALRLANGQRSEAPNETAAGVPLEPLMRAVLDRACAYGLWECGPGFDPAAVPAPLSRARFAVLMDCIDRAQEPDEALEVALAALDAWIRD